MTSTAPIKLMKIVKNLNVSETAVIKDSRLQYGETPLNSIYNGSKVCLLHNYSVFYDIGNQKLIFHSVDGKQSVRVVDMNFTHFTEDPSLICVKTLDFVALWGITINGSTR
jgi:hypothetical protein